MNVLVTNDDGIDAAGLRLLVLALADLGHDVYVIAPDPCHSAGSMRITVGPKLTVTSRDVAGATAAMATSGTPVDCVKLALTVLDIPRPDLLVSGINFGLNVARDLLYSGTVGAALEGADSSLPSIAISAERSSEGDVIYEQAATTLSDAFPRIWNRIQLGTRREFVNINVPMTPMKGVRWTRVSEGSYFVDGYDVQDGTYQLNGPRTHAEQDIDTDLGAIEAGYASISFVRHRWES